MPHTLGHFAAILISLGALYGVFAFVKTKIFHRPQYPWRKVGIHTIVKF